MAEAVEIIEDDPIEVRRAKREALIAAGIDPYGHSVKRSHSVGELNEKYAHLEDGESTEDEVLIAGRVMAKRVQGKIAFLELREMVALGWFCWVGRRPDAAQMQKLYGLLAQMDAIAYVPDGDKAAFLELLNAFLVCMFRESDNMIFRVMLRSTRELAHVAYYMVAYTLDMQELCRVYRAVLDGLTDGCVPEAIACWSAWSDRVTLRYREALEQLQSA